MRGKLVLLIVAAIVAIGTLAIAVSGASARGSHVEYTVPDQPGISVDQRGNAGIVNVQVTECLTVGEEFTFTMLISSTREGSSTLSVRKQGNPDIHKWFSLSPETVDLPSDGTVVEVKVKPPVDAELDRKAVTRIQEIGDGPSPGGHHGVKVAITCVKAPPPAPTPPPEVTPTPPTALVPPAVSTPTPQVPTGLPNSGGKPPADNSSTTAQAAFLGFGTTVALVGLGLFLEGRRHRIF